MGNCIVSKCADKTKILVTQSIRIAIVVTLLVCSPYPVLAQDRPAEPEQLPVQAEVQSSTPEQAPLDLIVASDGYVSSSGNILRLEETIRGNKEQPKVLSIVPWQLPLYQRIDRNEQRWAPIKTKLNSLERNSFLKEIKLLEGIQNGHSDVPVDAQEN